MSRRYRFIGASGNRLVWQAALPDDSRVMEVTCNRAWFYEQMIKKEDDDAAAADD